MLFSFYTSAHHVGRGDSVFGLCLLPHRRSVRLSVTKETLRDISTFNGDTSVKLTRIHHVPVNEKDLTL